MNTDPRLSEEQAYKNLAQGNYEEAYKLYLQAGEIYKSRNNHKQSALCFASAASCWSVKSGEKAFYNSAVSYEEAARQAEKSKDFEYASLLFKHAAINYERDIEFSNFSDCFYRSKEAYRKFLERALVNPKGAHHMAKSSENKGLTGKIKYFFVWLVLTFSYVIWGHGERPLRTFFSAIAVIILAACAYTSGELISGGNLIKPDFSQAFYFSVVTYTTIGYGDITPIGFTRMIVIIEALCGLFITSLLFVGLSRKYLRI